ncbi:MAG: hypothetical protein K0Q91_1014 [Fibrobacteria bacterium]|jgi:hypothetical protein|nr:hypothetical protein [Fibrobacteria bacterium]
MLEVKEFAEALRHGIARSGLGRGKPPSEAGYVSLAGTLLEYLRENLEVTVPPGREGEREVRCRVR